MKLELLYKSNHKGYSPSLHILPQLSHGFEIRHNFTSVSVGGSILSGEPIFFVRTLTEQRYDKLPATKWVTSLL